LPTDTTINDPNDFGMNKDRSQLACLQHLGRTMNRRLLDVQRVSRTCHLSLENVERAGLPAVITGGQRAPGLRLGQTRVIALPAALTSFVPATQGLNGTGNLKDTQWI
jgi:hypothetical protein